MLQVQICQSFYFKEKIMKPIHTKVDNIKYFCSFIDLRLRQTLFFELLLLKIDMSIIIMEQNIQNPGLALKKCCIRQGCEDIQNYKRLNKIHEGVYGVVYRAVQIPTSKIYAIKKLKLREGEDFPITSLRQISILKGLNHPNIIKITRVAGSKQRDKVYIVMQYIDHQLKALLSQIQFEEKHIKRMMKDLLEGMNYLHQRKIVHRDLKTSNLLYSNEGVLKICDFGLARKVSQAMMTQQVITMWYRPPQMFLDSVNYSTQIDIWSVGCIMAQMILGKPLFCGKTDLQQLDLIFRLLGSPTEQSWPQFRSLKNSIYVMAKRYSSGKLRQLIPAQKLSDDGIKLLQSLLTLNPKKRITAKSALSHPWLKSGIADQKDMPNHEPLNQKDRVRKKIKPNQ